MVNNKTNLLRLAIVLIGFSALVCLFVFAGPTKPAVRSAALHVTITDVVSTTSLSGTFNEVFLHNRDTSDGIMGEAITIFDNGSDATTFTTMSVYFPPGASRAFPQENITAIKLITESGNTANVIIERTDRK